jgi:hypothetical protein
VSQVAPWRDASTAAGTAPSGGRIGGIGRRGLTTPARAAVDAAGYGIGGLLAGIAAARSGKAVHPHGVVHEARLVVDGSPAAPPCAELLHTPADHMAIMRFSRSLGLPRPLPDLLGISLRVIDAYGADRHQDVLTVSSVDLPVLHHGFLPARDVQQRPYSSSLPYRAGDRTFLLGIVPDSTSPRTDGETELERLASAAATGRLTFTLAVAPVNGRFRHVGTLHVGTRLSDSLDALRFSPFNCGGGLEPAGLLNRLRDYAYPLSQAAWGRRGDRAAGQLEAEAEQRRLARKWSTAPSGSAGS